MRLINVGVSIGWLVISAFGQAARADGGALRLSQTAGNYRISVFTSPTPFCAGPVDISVLVQDAITGEVIPTTSVAIQLVLHSQPDNALCYVATTKAATNKLFKAAVFDLPGPGRWRVKVTVDGGQGTAQLHFELEAAPHTEQWPILWTWISWPAAVVLLFSIHQVLVWRKHLMLHCS
jgi:hypothetical protein